MARLILENMEFYAFHGHYHEERIIGNRFMVDLVIETDINKPAQSDQLEDAIDYSRVYQLVKKEMSIPSNLLEHLAERIAASVKSFAGSAAKITVTVSKLNPSIGGPMSKFSVIHCI